MTGDKRVPPAAAILAQEAGACGACLLFDCSGSLEL